MNAVSQMNIHEAGFPNRAIHAFQKLGKYKTVGEVAKASDEALMEVPKVGRKTINQIRQRLAEISAKAKEHVVPRNEDEATVAVAQESETFPTETVSETSPEVEWAKNHPHLLRAIMSAEVTIRVKA